MINLNHLLALFTYTYCCEIKYIDWFLFHRKLAATYAQETKYLFLMLMEAIFESLRLVGTTENNTTEEDEMLKEFQDGSQLMVVNCYPPCPQPDLTLGMPPHSDYGFLTLLLQDEVEGLQIQKQDQWVTVEPIPNSFVVNVGDHLEVSLIIIGSVFVWSLKSYLLHALNHM